MPRNFSCSESLGSISIDSPSNKTIIGGNVTLVCYSKTGCLPINYTLFFKKEALRYATTNKMEERAVFNFTITSANNLGEYKCKAQNNNGCKYSTGFNFALRVAEEKKNLAVYIVPPLLLLLVVIGVAVPLLILPWCKARKLTTDSTPTDFVPTSCPSLENCATYDTVYEENITYCKLKFNTKKEDCRNVILDDNSAVEYTEVVIQR
ncbi:allergin-1 [Rhineura floridana]|uniref:allergin-1 n=1 Tax=Rhineura floridana TaxID=261503 RepID=UPI002AC843FC|nr:allergin-1 [Rhineura floridana]